MTFDGMYDRTGLAIEVDPGVIYAYGTKYLPQSVENIAVCLKAIADIWDGLNLGWVGRSKEEADDFNARWNSATTKLFGTKEHPEIGVFYRIGMAAGTGASNYGNADQCVMSMFESITQSLHYPSGTSSSGHRDDGLDPIKELS
jgi:hypothetical protein